MKRLSLLLLVTAFAISCNKADDTSSQQSGNFTITGVRDVDLSVTSTGSYTFPISVVSTSGLKETVSLSGDLVPGGVYASFNPSTGITPFTSLVTISTDYSTGGGTFPFKIKGTDSAGSRSYDIKATLAAFRGWQLASDIYESQSVEKNSGGSSSYASIKVTALNGAQLHLAFAANAGLPIANSTYKISGDTGKSNIQITMYEGAHIWSATGKRTDGSEAPTGVFAFDTLHRFTFKCSSVELSDGLKKLPLNCSFSE